MWAKRDALLLRTRRLIVLKWRYHIQKKQDFRENSLNHLNLFICLPNLKRFLTRALMIVGIFVYNSSTFASNCFSFLDVVPRKLSIRVLHISLVEQTTDQVFFELGFFFGVPGSSSGISTDFSLKSKRILICVGMRFKFLRIKITDTPPPLQMEPLSSTDNPHPLLRKKKFNPLPPQLILRIPNPPSDWRGYTKRPGGDYL